LVSETDVAKLAVGNHADLTLDAYGSDTTFSATVTKLDPAPTTKDDVTGYKATFQLDKPDARIKPGLTANANVLTQERDALAVPDRSVLQKGDHYTVLVKNGDDVKEQEVSIGIRGSDGWWEITSGLNAGDQVVDFGN
jgi:HlyD family secretion protein